mmetsp:Transcript_13702/g.42818  ORF Transcript_13702/g.42818 Transcript_13702/m.42818 type:complete len:244 (-) Transcript_13702:168-899(-)
MVHRVQVCSVVPRGLHRAGALRGRPVMLLHDQRVHALLAARLAEVPACGENRHEEGVLLREGREAQHVAAGKEEGPDVHGGPVAVGRDELHVALHGLADALDEHLGGDLRHPELPRALLHAAGVQRRVHQAHHAVLAGKRLQALEDGDAVVERAAVDVQQDVGGRHKGARVPAPVRPRVLHVAVQRPDLETQVVPAAREVVHLRLPDARGEVGVDLLVLHHRRRRRPQARQLHVGPGLRGGRR